MRILMVSSEAEPFSKTGGLADVAGSLPAALRHLGHEVGVVVPLYRRVELRRTRRVLESLTVDLGGRRFFPRVVGHSHHGVRFYFVDYAPFFDRDGLYGTPAGDYPDNADRFALFSQAAIEAAKHDFQPDLLHCHDWQAALVPVMLKTLYANDPAFRQTPVLLTIHNLGYQGIFPGATLADLGLPPHLFHIDGLEFYGRINLLKGGLLFADALSTVSRAYAREIQTPEFGHGLDGVLKSRADVLSGVLNGVDYRFWNPATDKLIAANYSADRLEGKAECKRDLLASFGLPDESEQRPVVGMVTRLAHQKGADLVVETLDELLELGVCITILGAGDQDIVDLLKKEVLRHPDRIALRIAYDNGLAHKVEAGADIFLMPSRYEPCGLNQMYSLKYGTVPVVRATGGLDDTIEPFDPGTRTGNGFKFSDYSAAALLEAMTLAVGLYQDKHLWHCVMTNGMTQDFSWDSAAASYSRLYQSLVKKTVSLDSDSTADGAH